MKLGRKKAENETEAQNVTKQKENQPVWKKKIPAVVLVLLFFAFAVSQFSLYSNEILPVNGDTMGDVVEEIPLHDKARAQQNVVFQEEDDYYISVDIRNPALNGNTGTVYFCLYDTDWNLIQKEKISAAQLKARQKYRFHLEAEVELGKTYCFQVATRGVDESQGMLLTLTNEKSEYFTDFSVNKVKNTEGLRLRTKLMHPGWNMKKIGAVAAVFLLVFTVIWIPFRFPDPMQRLFQRVLFVLTPVACFAIVEKTCGYKIFSMKQPALNLNLWIYAMVLILVYLIVNNTRLAATITLCFSYAMALINYFVTLFRGTVFVPADIMAAGTAANVLNNYSFQITSGVLWGGIGLMCFLTALYKCKSHKGMRAMARVGILCAYAMMVVAFFNIFFQSDSLEEWKVHYKVWNPAISYHKNGFAVCFVVGTRYLIPEKPSNYSAENAEKLAEPYIEEAKNQEVTEEKQPNIIVIMNEAFSDLSYDGELKVSEDYMPFIRNLTEDTIKGNLHVSVFGGRTANTEYEVLTGMSLAFFPGGTVPYQHQMKHEISSLATILKLQNYTGLISMHPYKSNGYNRETAYPMMGFEQYYSKDLFENPELVRNYISDKADFEKIIQLYEESKKESDDPFFLFNVTMQNHGGYGEDYANLPLNITIEDDNKMESAERYLNLVKKTDEAFEELLDYYKSIDDPTIVVMFGDHQPNLSDSFFTSLIGKDTVNTLEGTAKEHVVPFIIWANYDIEEEEIDQISANYLGTKIVEAARLQKTPFQCFLSDMVEEVPVITGNYYIGKDGEIRELSDKEGYEEWIDTYHTFQYNQVYDYKNQIPDFFSLPTVEND